LEVLPVTLQEIERRRRQRRQSDPVRDREIELARSLDDDKVLTFKEWCALNSFSARTGRRVINAGKVRVVRLSERRIGIRVADNRRFQLENAR
jgi:hypothetical protein